MSRYRDTQLQVGENCLYLFNMGPNICKYWCLNTFLFPITAIQTVNKANLKKLSNFLTNNKQFVISVKYVLKCPKPRSLVNHTLFIHKSWLRPYIMMPVQQGYNTLFIKKYASVWDQHLTRFGTARVYDYWRVAVARTASFWLALPPTDRASLTPQATELDGRSV